MGEFRKKSFTALPDKVVTGLNNPDMVVDYIFVYFPG